ncbi:MAG: hypothetical protein H0X39_06755 [Actinobacteria bacterium]|nr:hypothetical protein [Actinomycetota bacterium]
MSRIVQTAQAIAPTAAETIAYRIDGDDVIVWVNDAWERFADTNGWARGDAVLGRSLWESIAGAETSLLWRELVTRARRGVAINVPFRCDAPDARRYLELSLTPGGSGALEFCSTTTAIEERDPIALMAAHYEPGEPLRCCSWCKRFDTDGWVEVEEAVARLGLLEHESRAVTHAMCAECESRVRNSAGL